MDLENVGPPSVKPELAEKPGLAEKPELAAKPRVAVAPFQMPYRRVLFGPGGLLLAAAILLPAILFALAAWANYRETLREANSRVDRTVRVLQEHAVKVFETHRLVIDQVKLRLRFMDWNKEADRLDLHALLKKTQDDFDQIETVTVTDPDGHLRASSRSYPVDPTISFADRDWFKAVTADRRGRPFVSAAVTGRQSGEPVFNLAAAVADDDGAFPGAVSVSIDRRYFERFYEGIERDFDYSITLVRSDGSILARIPTTSTLKLTADAPFFQYLKTLTDRAFTSQSIIDDRVRIFAYRKIGAYPVFVGFGIPVDAALGPWRQNLATYGVVAALASVALLTASLLAIRQTNRERLAVTRWRETAAALETEAAQRAAAEAQLRQSQKMEAVGRLTGGVAHDFNNLLTVVLGNLDLLRRRLQGGEERFQRLIANAIDGTNRAATLTHRLLAFSRQQPLAPTRVDVNALVGGMSDILYRTLGENIAVEIVSTEDLWPTFADANQLESALLNLAVNARDAMPDGGTLTVETANTHLDQSYTAAYEDVTPGDYVMVAVADAGTGMAPDIIAKVFEPFFTTKPVGKGTGLGLSQVYGFAKQSGGHVGIYSELDHGTTIKLYLPRHLQAGRPALESVEIAQTIWRSAKAETILVVEDEPGVRQFSVAALAEAGYTVLDAENGVAALETLRAHPEIALLFTDVVLTGPMNGRMLADEALIARPDLPVLFTTGYTRNAIVHNSRLDEGINFLGKPFSSAGLTAKIHHLLLDGTRS